MQKNILRLLCLLLLLGCWPISLFATRERIQGFCQNGGVSVTVPGTVGSGTQRFQQTFRGCTVTVYQAGTTTLSTIYSNANGTAQANPFTANTTTGAYSFYADGGRYDLRFSSGGIPTPFTLGDFRIPNEVFNVTDYGALCDGTTNDYAAVDRARIAATALANGGTVLFPSGTCLVNSSITFDADITLHFEGGGRISMAAGTTATIQGPVVAPESQIFAGSGTIVGTASRSVASPQWYGAVGDGVADDTAPFFNTVRNWQTVFVPDGTYLVNNLTRRTIGAVTNVPGAIWPISNQTITLSKGALITTRAYVAGDDCSGRVFGVYSVSNVVIQGGSIQGNYSSYPTPNAARVTACGADGGNHGIEVGDSTNVTIRDIRILENFGDGWTVSYIADQAGKNNSRNINFNNVTSTRNYRNAASCVGWDGGTIVGGEYSYTVGSTSPETGIDFEPNTGLVNLTAVCEYIYVINPKLSNNDQSDFQILNARSGYLVLVGVASNTLIMQNSTNVVLVGSNVGNPSNIAQTTYSMSRTAANQSLGTFNFHNSNTTDGQAVEARIEAQRGTAGNTGQVSFETRDGTTLAQRMLIGEANVVSLPNATSDLRVGVSPTATAIGAGSTFANLGADNNGTIQYCSDCTIANPCGGAGTGAIAKRLNGAWVCN